MPNRLNLCRNPQRAWIYAFVSTVLVCFAPLNVRADVGIVLNESLDTSVAWVTGSGHSAVYISRACPETPVKLRLCRPDEQGSIISNYTTLGEDQPYQWNAVSLSMYLYGVEDPRNRPLFGSPKVKHALEERYRLMFLDGYCDTQVCRTSGKAEWREMVAATISRSVYVFIVKTTPQQDARMIAELNSEPNQNHFNGVTRNCATFTRHIIDTYFPGSAKPEYINDFGMTSPKAIARSFSHYATRHSELEFRVLHFAQVPGTYRRSTECRDGTEQLYHSKKLLVPMAIFANHELPFVVGSYVLTGRFNPEHEWEKFPDGQKSGLTHQMQQARDAGNQALLKKLAAQEKRARAVQVGTHTDWKNYRREFNTVLHEALADETIPDHDYVKRFFKYIDQNGAPVLDPDGSLWIRLPEAGEDARIGLSADNLLAPTSNAPLADQFMLARIYSVLKSPKHSRETMPELKTDWGWLQRTRSERLAWVARAAAGTERTGAGTALANSAFKRDPRKN